MPVAAAAICIVWHRRLTNAPAHRWLRDQIASLTRHLEG